MLFPNPSIHGLSNDLRLMYKCVKEMEDSNDQKYKRVQGGLGAIDPFHPVYFQDDDYRQRRHAYVQEILEEDERLLENQASKSHTIVDIKLPKWYKKIKKA
jgi:hypothetical protein